MLKNKRIKPFYAVLLIVCLIISVCITMAVFTDRVQHEMKLATATFSAEGYSLTRVAPDGPFVAGEDIAVTLKESNTDNTAVKSVVTMSTKWTSPDTSLSIFGNANAADNATITIDGKNVSYTVNDDGTITYVLPEHLLSSGAKNQSRELVLHIPESFKSTGEISFTFDKVSLDEHPYGFSKEFSHEDLNKKETLDFDVRVGWAASNMSDSDSTPNGHKALMGYLTEKDSNDMFGIEFKFEFKYDESAMKDFSSKTNAKWSYYKDAVNRLEFTEGMTSIGDYAFPEFSEVSSVTFPSTMKDIGISAFDGSGLTGEVIIPANVTNIESLAFGNLPNVNVFTFKHTKNNLTLPDNTSSGNTKKGAFYVSSHVDTTVNTTVEEIMYGYRWHDGWDNRRYVPTLNANYTWRYDPTTGTEYVGFSDTPITTITFADYYVPDGTETVWDASDSSVPGSVTAYLSEDGKQLTLAGNGYGLIFANEDSVDVFCMMEELTTVKNADLFDTRYATDMYGMFYWCLQLKNIDISTWNVSKVERMEDMFRGDGELVSLDMSKKECTAKDGSGTYTAWDTGSLKCTQYMFMLYNECDRELASVDVTGWDTSSLEDATYMFFDCRNLKEIKGIEAWNVESLQIGESMFASCNSLEELDVSGWDTSSLENSAGMFSGCSSLADIDISNWDMSSITESWAMFTGCDSIAELTIPATLSVIGNRFAAYCPNLTTITFLQPAGMDLDLPTNSSSTNTQGAFYVYDNGLDDEDAGYVKYTPVNLMGTKVITENQDVLDYAWVKDGRGYKVTVETVDNGSLATTPSHYYNGRYVTSGIKGNTISLDPTPDSRYLYDGATVKYTENGSANTIELAADKLTFTMPNANVTVTPKFVHDGLTYITLKYMDDVTADETILYTGQDLPSPTRDGYTFGGWYEYDYTDSYLSPDFTSVDASQPWTRDSNGVWSSNNTRPSDAYMSTSDMLSTEFTIQNDGSTVSFDWLNDGKSGYSALGYDIYNVETGEYLSGKTTPDSWSCYKYIAPATDYVTETVTLDKGTYQLLFMFNVNHNITVTTTNKGYVKNIQIPERTYNYDEEFDENNVTDGDVLMAKWIEAPMLAASNTWYTSSTARSTFTTINIVDSADAETIATATESWPAAADQDGDGTNDSDIMCYITGTELTIAGNGADKIMANPDCSLFFSQFSAVTVINGLNLLDTSNVTTMKRMFMNCSRLTSLDVSNFDTSSVTDMEYMFGSCSSLTSLDVSNFETSNVTDMKCVFYYCKSLTSLDVSNFNTSKVTTMDHMFSTCESLGSIDVSNFNTSKVTDMKYMFGTCKSLTSIDVSNLNTSRVTTMMSMFGNCTSLTSIDVSTFNISKVKSMEYMFYGCHSLESIDVSMFDTSNVTNLKYMFGDCPRLTTFIFGENFGQTNNVPDANGLYPMFYLYEDTVLDTTVYGANDVMKAYDWAANNRNVTFKTALTLNVDSNGSVDGFTVDK